ncbi:MAG TPA: hypothetical protein VG347_15130 [Verrucomicrobiae bacterium]|nr:hypothetical protein [Verrucomicrobiae bacterium]
MGADSDSTLKLLIEMGVVGQDDVRAANALVAETGQKGKEALDGMNGSMPENLEAWGKYKNALHEAGEEGGELHETLHGVAQAGRMAGGEFAEFGHLAHAALNPVSLALVAVTIGFEAISKLQERIAEKIKDMQDASAKVADTIHEMVNAGGSADQIFESMNQILAESEVKATGVQHAIERMQTASQQVAEHLHALNDNLKTEDESQNATLQKRIDLLKQLGVISAEDADKKKIQADLQEKLNGMAAEMRQLRQDASDAEKNFTDLKIKQHELPSEADALTKQKAAQFQVDRDKTVMDLTPKALRENEEAQEAAKKLRDDTWATPAARQLAIDELRRLKEEHIQLGTRYNETKDSQADHETALASANDVLKAVQDLPAKIEAAQDKANAAAQKVTDSDKTGAANEARLQAAIETFQAILKDSGKTPEQIIAEGATAQDDIKRLLGQGYTPQKIQQDGEKATQDHEAGRNFDQNALDRLTRYSNDRTMTDRLNALLQSMGDNQNLMTNIMDKHAQGQINLQNEIDRLYQQAETILRWQKQHNI